MIMIETVEKNSYAAKAGIAVGDSLIAINGHSIRDVLDYRFYMTDKKLVILLCRDGGEFTATVTKPEYADLGLDFSTYLMDQKRRCRNNCIFCFIDQNPPGMRETIYFKDDDERLSFLQGNYVTLTNMTDREVERIITMRISPINVSVHTVNPELRNKMMGNRFAGESLRFLEQLDNAGIALNTQLVLCKGINDGEELARSLEYLTGLTSVESIAAVPCGLSGYRNGLHPLEPFDQQSAGEVLDLMHKYGDRCVEQGRGRLVFAADEFYLLAEREVPPEEFYESFPQIENGVGMIRSHYEEFLDALANLAESDYNDPGRIFIATGEAAVTHITGLVKLFSNKFPQAQISVRAIKNNFFGGKITVSGLVVGQDIIEQVGTDAAGGYLFIPVSMLRHERDFFLDGTALADVEVATGTKLILCEADGSDLVNKLAGLGL